MQCRGRIHPTRNEERLRLTEMAARGQIFDRKEVGFKIECGIREIIGRSLVRRRERK